MDVLLDPTFKDCIDYEAKPIFREGQRVFGPLRSGTLWEDLEHLYPKKTIIPVAVYSDSTEFMKGSGAHPMFGMLHIMAHDSTARALYLTNTYNTCTVFEQSIHLVHCLSAYVYSVRLYT